MPIERADIKHCPFCGSEAWLLRTNDNHKRPYVQCKWGCYLEPKCPLSHYVSWDFKTEEEAVEAWNRRLPPHDRIHPPEDIDIPIEYFEAGGT